MKKITLHWWTTVHVQKGSERFYQILERERKAELDQLKRKIFELRIWLLGAWAFGMAMSGFSLFQAFELDALKAPRGSKTAYIVHKPYTAAAGVEDLRPVRTVGWRATCAGGCTLAAQEIQ